MIFNLILNVVALMLYALAAPLLLLPDVTLSTAFSTAIEQASELAISINAFFPVVELFYMITGTLLVIEGGILTIRLVNWIIRKIPGIS